MSRVRSVRAKAVVPKNVKKDTAALQELMQQMMGITDAEVRILAPKIVAIRELLIKITRVLSMFIDIERDLGEVYPGMSDAIDDIETFRDGLIEKFSLVQNQNTKTKPDYDHRDERYYLEMEKKDINLLYKNITTSEEMNLLIITTGRLKQHHRHISDSKKLSDAFIQKEPGLVLCPFAFSNLNLKAIWENKDLKPPNKKFVIDILHRMFIHGKELHLLRTSANVDIKQMSSMLIGSLARIESKIPGCKKAFNLVKGSVGLLETKFNSYYRKSITSQNSGIIIELFLSDIIKNQKHKSGRTDKILIKQLNRITQFLVQKANASKARSDPRLKNMFGMLQKQFAMYGEDENEEKKSSPNDGENDEKETKEENDIKCTIQEIQEVSDDVDWADAPPVSKRNRNRRKRKKKRR